MASLTSESGLPIVWAVVVANVSFSQKSLDEAAEEIVKQIEGVGPPGSAEATRETETRLPESYRAKDLARVRLRVWGMPWGIFFYSGFFTSFGVWLYALSGTIVRLTRYLGVGLCGFSFVFDIENKPLRSLGLVSNVIITIVYLVMPFVR